MNGDNSETAVLLRRIGLGFAVLPLLMSMMVVMFLPALVTIAAMLVSIKFTIVGVAVIVAGGNTARLDERVRQHGEERQHPTDTTG